MKLRPTEILAAFASAVSLLNLAKDFVGLEEALREWINVYDAGIVFLFSLLEPFTSLPGLEITPVERHLILIFLLPTVAANRGFAASPTSRQFKAGVREPSSGVFARTFQAAVIAVVYALFFVVVFAIAPALAATAVSVVLLLSIIVRFIILYPDRGLRQFRVGLVLRQLLQVGAAVVLLLLVNAALMFITSL